VGTLIDQLFQGYFSLERSGGQLLESRYDPLLVTLSYLIAVFAVYTTIGLVAHMRREFEAGRQKNRYWWAGAALTLGGGIFVMHFVAMLAFSIQVEVRYDLGMTLLSLLVAVVGSAVALMQIRGRLSFPRLIWGGVWMGGGVGGGGGCGDALCWNGLSTGTGVATLCPRTVVDLCAGCGGGLYGHHGAVLLFFLNQGEDLICRTPKHRVSWRCSGSRHALYGDGVSRVL